MAGISLIDIGEDDGQVNCDVHGHQQAVTGRVEAGTGTDEDIPHSPAGRLAYSKVTGWH